MARYLQYGSIRQAINLPPKTNEATMECLGYVFELGTKLRSIVPTEEKITAVNISYNPQIDRRVNRNTLSEAILVKLYSAMSFVDVKQKRRALASNMSVKFSLIGRARGDNLMAGSITTDKNQYNFSVNRDKQIDVDGGK